MKKLIELLKKQGIEVSEEQEAAIKKEFFESYKASGEVAKTAKKIEDDRDAWKKRAEDAEGALKGFDGIDPEKINAEIATWKKKAEDAEADYTAKIKQRDFDDALRAAMDGVRFSSNAARESVMQRVKAKGLSLEGGKILGLSDFLEVIKTEDASAFVDEKKEELEGKKAKFTDKQKDGGEPGSVTVDSIMSIKDAKERQDMIAKHMDLFR